MSILNVLKKSIFHSIRSVQLKIMSQIQPSRRVIILSKTNSENIFKPILIPVRANRSADKATRRSSFVLK